MDIVASSRVGVFCCSFRPPIINFGVGAFHDPFCCGHISIGLEFIGFSVVYSTMFMIDWRYRLRWARNCLKPYPTDDFPSILCYYVIMCHARLIYPRLPLVLVLAFILASSGLEILDFCNWCCPFLRFMPRQCM